MKDLDIKEGDSQLMEFFVDEEVPQDIDVGNKYRLQLVEIKQEGDKKRYAFRLTI